MPSYFTWLDYSDKERRKVLDVIHLFEEKDARDELGIGVVRDAIADLLFPGTGTVQTRARYFFFVPWMYMDLERKKVGSSQIADRARKRELDLIGQLLENGETEGVIGRVARRTLQRLPSNIYWLGLTTLGFKSYGGSQDTYHRSLDQYYSMLEHDKERRTESSETALTRPNWNKNIPPLPEGFPDNATLEMLEEEAIFLQEQILTQAPDSLFAWLVENAGEHSDADMVWHHESYDSFPDHNKVELEHGRLFSEAMHGAALLYNVLLAEMSQREFGQKEESDVSQLLVSYRELVEYWRQDVFDRREEFIAWDLRAFWEMIESMHARVTPATKRFVETWIAVVRTHFFTDGWTADSQLVTLIRDREAALKGKNARLTSRSALEHWSGASGTGQLSYRWNNARRILDDIHAAFEKEA